MSMPTDKPRQWITITLTLAADTDAELHDALDDFADEAFLWQQQPVDEFARFQREAHVSAVLGTPDWIECH